jgi:hypothetical protein
MKKHIVVVLGITLITLVGIGVSYIYFYPFFLKNTRTSNGVVVEYKDSYANNFSNSVIVHKYNYIFKTKNEYILDWEVRRRDKDMFLGKKIALKYSIKTPQINKVKKYFSNNPDYRKFECEKSKGFLRIELINGYFIKKDFRNYNQIGSKTYGEYTITNDTVKLFLKPNIKIEYETFVLKNNYLISLENKSLYTEKN